MGSGPRFYMTNFFTQINLAFLIGLILELHAILVNTCSDCWSKKFSVRFSSSWRQEGLSLKFLLCQSLRQLAAFVFPFEKDRELLSLLIKMMWLLYEDQVTFEAQISTADSLAWESYKTSYIQFFFFLSLFYKTIL